MDDAKAAYLENELQGKLIDRWEILSLIDHGKSAAVFLASHEGKNYAVKIFDDELIKKYGDDTQLERINRELALIGKQHPHLVEIVGGGVDSITQNHYIVMEYIPYPNLKHSLATVPPEDIPLYIDQLSQAARFLEELGLVHRDIKPENIAISIEDKSLKLLDLGVMRPIKGSTLTDGGGLQHFIGTLQYSPPEFLLRQEEESIEGYRAITFYQIGAVIHDLIMRRPLFSEFETPYPRLVNAIQNEIPEIQNEQVESWLVHLAKCCLLKDPEARLKLTSWDYFACKGKQSLRSAKQRVTTRVLLSRAENAVEIPQGEIQESQERAFKDLNYEALEYIKNSIKAFKTDNSTFPLCTVTANNGEIRVAFDVAKEIRLYQPFSFRLCLEILDPRAKAIKIIAKKQKDGEDEEPEIIYAGIFDAVNIYNALEEYTYQLIDQQQQK